jgi:hypothetical protein
MNDLPGISCYCATYGRSASTIENSIQCFLDQDWLGKKELIILNDCKYQKFIYNHPEIKIINIDERIPILGKKFNETVKLCSYEYIATWEDDDSFLRNRLTYSFNNLKTKLVFHTYDGFIEKKYKELKISTGYFHSTHLIYRDLFQDIGMYNESDTRGIDIKLMHKIRTKIPGYSTKITDKSQIFYIYNWLFDSYHASSSTYQVIKKLNTGKLESGTIELKPKLRYNYYEFLPI